LTPDTTPHPIDLHVGARLRLGRKMRDVPQRVLADALGISFQQVQKYERGTNRISASVLLALARLLKLEIAWFFEGLAPTDEAQHDAAQEAVLVQRGQALRRFLATREGPELALLVAGLPVRQRFQVLSLIRAFADTEHLDAAE